MDKKLNAVGWFEIPVVDMERAKRFYTSVLNVELTDYKNEACAVQLEMTVFPHDCNNPSYGCSGALVKGEGKTPSQIGTLVYFHCEDINNELVRVKENGGTVLFEKLPIDENGFISHIIDTEGNRIGLHSMN